MREKSYKKKYPLWFQLLIPLLEKRKYPEMSKNPLPNRWYRIYPENCVGADGNPTHAQFYLGTENKLIVFFCGGGFSINEYTAARPAYYFDGDASDMFYTVGMDLLSDIVTWKGILSKNKENPFANWSKICIPYDTGDFHVGNNDFPYTALDGSKQILHHHGYKNYRAIMDEVKKLVEAPKDMIVCGCSAGAFGTAMITDDVMSFYPECKNVVCLVDSALSISTEFHRITKEVWGAPEEIVNRIHSDNFVLDSLTALKRKHGDRVTCLYTSSIKDAALARMQNFMDGGKLVFSKESGERLYKDNKRFCDQLKENIPNVGIYLFNKADNSLKGMELTVHCIIGENFFFKDKLEDTTCATWVEDAVSGKVASYGLELLDNK